MCATVYHKCYLVSQSYYLVLWGESVQSEASGCYQINAVAQFNIRKKGACIQLGACFSFFHQQKHTLTPLVFTKALSKVCTTKVSSRLYNSLPYCTASIEKGWHKGQTTAAAKSWLAIQMQGLG